MCLDEAKDIVYAGDASGVIRSFQFTSGKAINAAGFAAPRVGQMRRDADGNIWAMQTRCEPAYTPITATAFGSEPREGHSAQVALTAVGGKTFFVAKDDEGFVGLEFEKLSPVHSVRFSGAGHQTALAGATLQGSTTGRDGPWTDIVSMKHECGWWPGTVIPLDGKEWRAVRIAGSKMGVAGPRCLHAGARSAGFRR